MYHALQWDPRKIVFGNSKFNTHRPPLCCRIQITPPPHSGRNKETSGVFTTRGQVQFAVVDFDLSSSNLLDRLRKRDSISTTKHTHTRIVRQSEAAWPAEAYKFTMNNTIVQLPPTADPPTADPPTASPSMTAQEPGPPPAPPATDVQPPPLASTEEIKTELPPPAPPATVEPPPPPSPLPPPPQETTTEATPAPPPPPPPPPSPPPPEVPHTTTQQEQPPPPPPATENDAAPPNTVVKAPSTSPTPLSDQIFSTITLLNPSLTTTSIPGLNPSGILDPESITSGLPNTISTAVPTSTVPAAVPTATTQPLWIRIDGRLHLNADALDIPVLFTITFTLACVLTALVLWKGVCLWYPDEEKRLRCTHYHGCGCILTERGRLVRFVKLPGGEVIDFARFQRKSDWEREKRRMQRDGTGVTVASAENK
ncbi:hypothetical protein FPQ18DRAFT_308169 [Pyronema domesticum]|nr:hypothetical protein FPQ18DRAFT_308169 [Pyronema domesticum]